MKKLRRCLAVLLTLCMIFTAFSVNVFAEDEAADNATEETVYEEDVPEVVSEAESEEDESEEDAYAADSEVDTPMMAAASPLLANASANGTGGSLDTSTFPTMVLIDCGRGYYSVENIESIIDTMSDNGYKYLMLGFGNDGLRFVLNDMSVTVDDTTYASDTVKNAVISANDTLQNNNGNGQWTEDQMDSIISYASEKNIGIVPMLNCPGHAYSVYKAMAAATGITDAYKSYSSSGAVNQYNYSIDLSNATVKGFVEGLVEKYISYFSGKGCKFFNFGCDESKYDYSQTVTYLNDVCSTLDSMVPMAFCDVLKSTSGYPDNLVGIDWDGGNLGSSHYHMNANDNWYYVLGKTGNGSANEWCTYEKSLKYTNSTPVTSTLGGETAYGSIFAVWNDSYLASNGYISNIQNLIKSQSAANPDYFTIKTDETAVTKTDSETNITVTAPGLSGLTVTKKESTGSSANQKIITYNITPTNASGNYEGSATVTIPVPSDWDNDTTTISVNDVEKNITVDSSVSDDRATISFTATHFSEYQLKYIASADTPSEDTPSEEPYTSEEAVTVSAGGTKDVTTTGANNAGTYTTQDTGVATVAVTGKDATQATTSHNSASSVKASTLATKTSWTKTSYYYKASDGEYYPVYAYYATKKTGIFSSTTTYYWGYSTTDSSSNVTSINNTTNSNTKVSGLYTETTTEGTAASTTITFTGVAEGTTSVVIGGVKYNITVTAEDLSGVSNQTIHLYCSTFGVWDPDDSSKKTTVSISAKDAYGVDGIDISTKVPASGAWAYGSTDSDLATTVFWKGVKLTYANRQSATSTEDRSMSGVNYSKIRYYSGQWSVYDDDNQNWVSIASDDEVDAYYLQKTTITNEVDTYVKDWAYTTQNCTDQTDNNKQKALSFAVVYPDGQMKPEKEDTIYTDSTLIYWYTTQNMFIRVGVNEVYEVEKITYTAGERINSSGTKYGTQTGNWEKTDRISWNKKTTTDGSIWYDETTCWTPETSTEPVIDCSQIDAFSFSKGNYTTNDAILVLIYLKPVTTEDSLTVKYVDDSNDSSEILNYSLNVTNTSTEAKGTFLNRLIQTSNVQAGEITLDDDAYVTNAKGTNETFQKDLQKIPSLMGTSYATGFYKYTKAEISADGKTLTLHYNVNSDISGDYSYVIDFGLGININISDITRGASYKSVNLGSAIYGTVSESDGVITYTPNKVLKSADAFKVSITYSDKTVSNTVKIYPATTVYYEEGFATYSDGWSSTGSKGAGTQTTSKANTEKATSAANYGYDSKYAGESAGASNGTQAISNAKGNSATFEFYGTGIDVYANTTTSTSDATVLVYKGDSICKVASVKTAMVEGTSTATDDQDVNGYNEPIYTLNNLERANYKVVVYTAAGTVNLDGFRVYGTMDTSDAVYANDLEDNPNYIELRNAVIKAYNKSASGTYNVYNDDAATAATVAIISNDADYSSTTVADLLTNGPKNELYLQPGQTLVFKVETSRQVQIGLKALNQSTSYVLNNADTAPEISTSTDMFYSISSGQTTIKNNGDGILAITKLKICDDPSAALAPLTDEDIAAAVEVAESEPQPVSADATLTVDVNGATTVLTKNGVEGEAVTFTAAEIQEAAEALVADGYELKTSYKDVATTYGANETVSFTATQKPVNPVQNFFKNFFNRFRNIFGRR